MPEAAADRSSAPYNGVAARIIALYSRMYGRTPPDLLQSESETTPLLLQLWQSINHEYAAESTLKELRTASPTLKICA